MISGETVGKIYSDKEKYSCAVGDSELILFSIVLASLPKVIASLLKALLVDSSNFRLILRRFLGIFFIYEKFFLCYNFFLEKTFLHRSKLKMFLVSACDWLMIVTL